LDSHAKKQGAFEIAKNFLKMNIPIEQIASGTGLSIDEVKRLQVAEELTNWK